MNIRIEHKTPDRWISICDGPVDSAAIEAFVRADTAGAVVVFSGTTRRFTDGRETVTLSYEAYDMMAVRTLAGLVDEAFANWPVIRVGVCHAVGQIELREASVCVAVATPHRADAFDAARFLIDRLKAEAAIWKKEIFEDGEVWVESPVETVEAALR